MPLSVVQLNARYRNRNVLGDVSVSFRSKLTYLIGANGSGKTTLLRCMAGLLPHEGEVILNQQPIKSLSRKEIAQQLAIVPQQFFPSFRIRVRDFVLSGRFPYLNWLGQYTRADYDKADQVLTELRLEGFSHRFVQELSGGELQKVLLARALCQDTPIMLLDEPAQSLDPFQKNWLYQKLTVLSQNGKTIVCATHDLAHLHQKDLSVIAIKSGRIFFHEAGMDLQNERFSQVYA